MSSSELNRLMTSNSNVNSNNYNQHPSAVNRDRPLPSDPGMIGGTGARLNAITPASFAHQAPIGDYSSGFAAGFYASMVTSLGNCLGMVGTFFTCCGCNPYRTVEQGTAGVITKFGRYCATVDPGLHYINILTMSIVNVNVKMQIGDIPRQTVITKDNVSVLIDSVIYWHILSPFTAVYEVSDINTALIERTMTTMRQIFGAHDLQDTITHREGIAQEIENVISNVAASWGVKVESILLKDIQFSKDLQENMSAAATARRLAAARIIQAESEVESAKLLREASDILDSKAAMQIRYLDTLKTMAREAGSKIIFMPPNAYGDKGSGGGGNNDNMKDLAAVALM